MTERFDHLDPATIAALVERTLDPDARARAEAHLAACPDCREVWVETSELAEAAGETERKPGEHVVIARRVPMRRWVYAGAGIAAAAAITLAVLSPQLFNRGDRPELRALIEAVGESRRTEGRLTGGFKWGPLPSATRSGAMADTPSAEVEVEAAALRLEAERSRTAATLAALGTAHLATGKFASAVEVLEEATASDPQNAYAWSDLAAAYLANSQYPGRAVDVPRALEAARAALRLKPDLLEARFNEVLAIERLGLKPEAIEGWRRYVAGERDPQWKEEAQRRLETLQGPQKTPVPDAQSLRERLFDEVLPSWANAYPREATKAQQALSEARRIAAALDAIPGDRLAHDVVRALEAGGPRRHDGKVAEAFAAYGRGRAAYRGDRFEDALPDFERAGVRLLAANNPLRHNALLHVALVRYRQERHEEAAALLDQLLKETFDRPYPSLQGRARWTRGLIHGLGGNRRMAIELYRQAHADFINANESANAASTLGLLATSYERVGDPVRSWDARIRALSGNPREGILLAAANSALRVRWFEVADILQAAAAARAKAAERLPALADALRYQAATAAARGDHARARSLLAEARQVAATRSGAAWLRIANEIDITAAAIGEHDGLAASDRALRYLTESGAHSRLPDVHLAQARLLKKAGNHEGARAAARAGLAKYEQLRTGLPADDAAASFGDVLRTLLDVSVQLEIERGQPEEAFMILERTRALDLQPSGAPVISNLSEVRRGLGERVRVIEFFVGETVTHSWLLTGQDAKYAQASAGRRDLQRLVDAATAPRFDTGAARRLRELLIDQFATEIKSGDTLVLVADGPLHRLPFAVLPGKAARFMVEEHPLVMTPSATVWARRQLRQRPEVGVIAIGDPLFDPAAFPGLPSLPYAVQEARLVRAAYPDGETLTGSSADRDAVLKALSSDRVVHFAGHALVNQFVPGESLLVTSGGGHDGITAAEIRRLKLQSVPLIVLAACQTTGGFTTESEGSLGLARAFLAAGVPTVIATQWPVVDEASRDFFAHLHREWRQTGDAAQALRDAQLGAIRQGRTPRDWAGIAVFEIGSSH